MMIPAAAPSGYGAFRMQHDGPITAGMRTSILFECHIGEAGLRRGARIRIGVPNTGWEEPVPPQQRYWDELIQASSRRLAPFHPVNTTVEIQGSKDAAVVLQVMVGWLAGGQGYLLATPAHIGGFIAGLLLQRPLLLWRYRSA